MDIATLVGIVLGFGLVLWSMASGAGIAAFVDIPSVAIVMGGTLSATLISFPLPKFLLIVKVLKKTLLYPLPSPQTEIERMADFAYVARREGLLALEQKIKDLDDAFLVKGVRLVVDGFPAQAVRDIMGIELFGMQSRHQLGKKLMDQMGAVAPAFGMIGTLIGLIAMLKSLDDPSTIGGGMAVALLTTFYGAVLSNMVFLPLGVKLDTRQKEETLMREIMIEGVVAIQAGDKPQVIKERLKSYLSPGERASLEDVKK
jgi:chemotaxis protein MotA